MGVTALTPTHPHTRTPIPGFFPRSLDPRQNHLIIRLLRAGPAHAAAVSYGFGVYQAFGRGGAGGFSEEQALFGIEEVYHFQGGAVGLADLALGETAFGIRSGDLEDVVVEVAGDAGEAVGGVLASKHRHHATREESEVRLLNRGFSASGRRNR